MCLGPHQKSGLSWYHKIGLNPLVKYLTGRSKVVFFYGSFLLFMFRVLSCFLVCSLQPCGHLLGKGLPLSSLVFDVFLCFCHLSMWCPGSSVELGCIDS